MSDRKISVSVIIPSYNRAGKLKNCLRSVFNQKFESKEVFVVDDGSTDDTLEVALRLFPEAVLIRHRKRMGASLSRNEAASRSRGDYLWFLDSDAVVENENCLSAMLDILENNSWIGSLGGEYTLSRINGPQFREKRILSNGETLTRTVPEKDYVLKECDFVATCNCLVKKSLFRAIGGFDPKYVVLSEDCEFGFKISKKSLANIVNAKTSVFHDIDIDKRRRDLFLSLKNRVRFAVKNFSARQIALLPLNELAYIFNTGHRRLIDFDDVNILKHVPFWMRGLIRKRKGAGITCLAALYAFCLFLAYIWNIVFLPQTLLYRNKKTYLA